MAKYFIAEGRNSTGPFTLEEITARGIRPDELVWTAGMDDWVPASTVEELAELIVYEEVEATPPPVPGAEPTAPEPASQPQPQYAPGTPPPPQQLMAMPSTWLVWAVISTVCCCIPFGIVAIVYASKVENLWYQGRYEEAYRASANARNWVIAAFVTGIAVQLGWGIFSIISGLSYPLSSLTI